MTSNSGAFVATLGEVMSVVTGRLLCDLDRLYAILSHMTGRSLSTIEIPDATDKCAAVLLRDFPVLADERVRTFAVGALICMMDTASGKSHTKQLIVGWLSRLSSGGYGVVVPETFVIATPESPIKVDPVPVPEKKLIMVLT